MAGLPEKFSEQLTKRAWFPKERPVVVAISGGVDSMVLLDLMAQSEGARLVVAHFNHQLRGSSSAADERLVREVARERKLRCVAGRGDVRAAARREGVSVEMAARQLRHKFLARVARKVGAKVIATAHHADDQVELFFLRLLRGASPEGLAGMTACEPSPGDRGLMLVRPLLDFRKAELHAWARSARLRFREDRSNRSAKFLRNRVRQELLPLLRRKYQPALEAVVLRTMEILGAESAMIQSTAAEWLSAHGMQRGVFGELPVAVQRAVVARQLIATGITPEFTLVERLCSVVNAPVMFGPGVCVERGGDGILRRKKVEKVVFDPAELHVDVSRSGSVTFGEAELTWTRRGVRDWKQALAKRPAGTELLDAEKVGSTLLLRHWRPGDRFQALGMPRPAKLQDWFVNRKVPAALRRRLVLAETAGGVLCWVEGQRLAAQFKLSAETREMLVWRWRRTV